MHDDLHRLVYYSRNRLTGSQAEIGAHIQQILEASRRNNAPVGITGALMFNAGCFGQVLEGRRDTLESTFERIQQDDRHGDVSLLAFEEIAARSFGHWSMGFVGARQADADTFAGVARDSGFDPSHASGDEMLATLRTLALEDEALAA